MGREFKAFKRFVCIFTFFLMISNFTGCNKSDGLDSNAPLINNQGVAIENITTLDSETPQDSTEDNEKIRAITVSYIGDFDGDYAETFFNLDGTEFFGCISKSGNITYAIRRDEIGDFLKNETPHLSNGVAVLCDRDFQQVIVDAEGNIVLSQRDGDFDNIVAYGDGYYCICTNNSDFSSSKYVYSIIDGSGKILAEHTEPEEMRCGVTYLGEGGFLFDYDHEEYAVFCIENGYVGKYKLWSESGVFSILNRYHNQYQRFNGGRIALQLQNNCVIIDKHGDVLEYTNYPESIIQPISENKIISYSCKNDSFNILVYDLINDKYCSLPEETRSYIDKIDIFKDYSSQMSYDAENRLLKFVDGCVAVNLTGEDGKQYIALVNCDREIISPIQCNRTTAVHCGRIIVETDEDTYIYNTDGQVVFSLKNINAQSINAYQSNVAIARDNQRYIAVDLDGNAIFSTDSIDVEHMKIVSLTEE